MEYIRKEFNCDSLEVSARYDTRIHEQIRRKSYYQMREILIGKKKLEKDLNESGSGGGTLLFIIIKLCISVLR